MLGAFGAIYNSLAMIPLPMTALESAQLSATMLGADAPGRRSRPVPAMPAVIAVGIAAAARAVDRRAALVARAPARRRPAWWIPLVAGVVAFVVVVIVGMFVLASDPTVLRVPALRRHADAHPQAISAAVSSSSASSSTGAANCAS